jgi:hypothetical protein
MSLVDYAKKAKKDCLIFKADFEKAYDSVDWGVFGVYDAYSGDV